MRRLFLLILLSLFAIVSFSQAVVNKSINWIPFEQALVKSKQDGKPVFLDVYTDWCGYCKRMDATTFQDTSVIRYINQHFHAAKLNAETTKPIQFRDSVYTNSKFVEGQRATSHDVVMVLTGNRPSYPTIVYILESKGIIAPVPGMQTVETIQPFLFYFGEKVYEITNLWEAFYKGYTAPKFTK
ncbi:MAG TPA: thioredoxin family protein [Bacteroidales bacterium]|nr:MAG: thiol:disulfide interchange protein precursor [Bacteroidetes bacterium ADurb.Bin217]HPH15663.1 thioredoxin family protein [Bacteroidales bacterium]HPM11909.1 thioredoxin family protein [Bacteroidales bacterium]